MWTLTCFWFVKGKVSQRNCKNNKISSVYLRIVCFFWVVWIWMIVFFTNQGPSLLNDRGIDIKAMIYFRELANRFLSCPLRSWLVPSVKVVIISAGLFKEWISMVKGWCGLVVSSLTFGIYDMVVWLCEGSGIRDPSVRFLGYHLRKGDSQDSENFQTSDLTKAPNYPSPNWR